MILFLLKKDELRNKTVGCIFCAPSHIFGSLLSVEHIAGCELLVGVQ